MGRAKGISKLGLSRGKASTHLSTVFPLVLLWQKEEKRKSIDLRHWIGAEEEGRRGLRFGLRLSFPALGYGFGYALDLDLSKPEIDTCIS